MLPQRKGSRSPACDDGVAIEERGSRQSGRGDGRQEPRFRRDTFDQRQRRKTHAFAAIVCAHCHKYIFDRDDQHQRLDEHRQHAKHMEGVDRGIMEQAHQVYGFADARIFRSTIACPSRWSFNAETKAHRNQRRHRRLPSADRPSAP